MFGAVHVGSGGLHITGLQSAIGFEHVRVHIVFGLDGVVRDTHASGGKALAQLAEAALQGESAGAQADKTLVRVIELGG